MSVDTATGYSEEDYLLISGIQHFSFCRRQWALMYIEGYWENNFYTTDGELKHQRAHDPFLSEKRGDIVTTGDMPVFSRKLGISGKCDIVEFVKDDGGVTLHGRNGRWLPYPVEYKRGSPKIIDADRLQLCAQAICLEEMLLCPKIMYAYIFYNEPRRRETIPLTDELRKSVAAYFSEMRSYYDRRYTPRVKRKKSCDSCSLKDICLPGMPSSENVGAYIDRNLRD